jgi:HK97 family phage portal protein
MSSKTLLQVITSGLSQVGGSKGTMYGPGSYTVRDGGFWSYFFGGNNFTGKNVTVDSVLQLSTAWACINLIARTLSTLPMHVQRRNPDGSTTDAPDERLAVILGDQPNADMASDVFWQCFIASMLLWGFAGVRVYRSASGQITSLEFLLPSALRRTNVGGVLAWRYRDPSNGVEVTIPDAEMWYTPAFTLDGINGISPIRAGANVFGGAMAADQAAADTFRNGMKASGLVSMSTVLQPQQREDVRKHVKTVYDSGGVMVLEAGSDFKQLTMNPQDAELLLTREHNIAEICRWYGVDPALVGHGAKDSNWGTGLEQKMLWMITLTLRFWCVRIERSIKRGLMTSQERRSLCAEFNLEALLRGDSASRAAFYSAMTQNGIFTRDFCRGKEGLPPMGGNAAVLTVQSNLLPIDKLGQQPPGVGAQQALKDWLGIPDTQPAKDD